MVQGEKMIETEGRSRARRVEVDEYVWSPPAGWVPQAPGVWIPSNYRPSRWELPTPVIHNASEAREDWLKCAKSLEYYMFRHCWTVDIDDPEGGVAIRKMPAYPYLRLFAREIQAPKNVHVQKSRRMLMSWAWMAAFSWDVIFHRNWSALIMSKRSKEVDKGPGEIDSNFGKLRFIHAHLPEHIWVPFIFKRFFISVPSTRSTITGETGKGSAASRGPGFKRALMDEAAYIERSESVFKGVIQACSNGTGLNSTPNGAGNLFHRIRHSQTTNFRKLSFHWSEHPRKSIGLYCLCGWKASPGGGMAPREQYQEHAPHCPRLEENPPRQPEMRSPWYDRQLQNMTSEAVASELDISYTGSRRGRVWTNFDSMRHVWRIMDRLGPRRMDETQEEYHSRYLRMALRNDLQTFTTMDIGVGDPTAMLLGQILDDHIPRVRFIDCIEEADKSYDFFGNVINTLWKPALASMGNVIAMRHYGGQDVKHRDSKLESWWSNLKAMGIHVEYLQPRPSKESNDQGIHGGFMLDWIDYINDFGYKRGNIEISDWCAPFLDAVDNYHYPTDEDTGEMLPGKQQPVHDEWSHYNDAKRYLFKIRYAMKLYDRDARSIPAKKVLARGGTYDRKSEHRIF